MENFNTNIGADKHPLVTVITVVYNNAIGVKDTIESVRAQTYPHIQYIIIDGGSTDGTVDVIKKYAGDVDYWVSEKDQGIYDAMNKGVAKARGEWVQFLHAGDSFADNDTLMRVFSSVYITKADIVYGNTLEKINSSETKRIIASNSFDQLWKAVSLFGHEAAFTRIGLLKRHIFNTAYLVAADYDFIFWSFINGAVFKNVDCDIIIIKPAFFSQKHWFRSSVEAWIISAKYHSKAYVHAFFFLKVLSSCAFVIFRKITPQFLYSFLRKIFRGLIPRR